MITDDAITGTLKYVTGYTGFSSKAEEQAGNYLAVAVSSVPGAEIKAKLDGDGKHFKTVTDGFLVVRLADTTLPLKLTATYGGKTVTRTLSLAGLTLEPAPEE